MVNSSSSKDEINTKCYQVFLKMLSQTIDNNPINNELVKDHIKGRKPIYFLEDIINYIGSDTSNPEYFNQIQAIIEGVKDKSVIVFKARSTYSIDEYKFNLMKEKAKLEDDDQANLDKGVYIYKDNDEMFAQIIHDKGIKPTQETIDLSDNIKFNDLKEECVRENKTEIENNSSSIMGPIKNDLLVSYIKSNCQYAEVAGHVRYVLEGEGLSSRARVNNKEDEIIKTYAALQSIRKEKKSIKVLNVCLTKENLIENFKFNALNASKLSSVNNDIKEKLDENINQSTYQFNNNTGQVLYSHDSKLKKMKEGIDNLLKDGTKTIEDKIKEANSLCEKFEKAIDQVEGILNKLYDNNYCFSPIIPKEDGSVITANRRKIRDYRRTLSLLNEKIKELPLKIEEAPKSKINDGTTPNPPSTNTTILDKKENNQNTILPIKASTQTTDSHNSLSLQDFNGLLDAHYQASSCFGDSSEVQQLRKLSKGKIQSNETKVSREDVGKALDNASIFRSSKLFRHRAKSLFFKGNYSNRSKKNYSNRSKKNDNHTDQLMMELHKAFSVNND